VEVGLWVLFASASENCSFTTKSDMKTSTRYRLTGKSRDSYLQLILAFPLASIQTDDHLTAAQGVMDQLLARGELDHGAAMYLDALSDLVAAYEDEVHPIGPASDADMLRHLLDARGVSQMELSREAGIPRSSVSEVMAGKKPFSRQMIRKLAAYFDVDPGMLAVNI
jgi:HTH-type transcriptional regulator/antitoxin HigA